MCIAAVDRQRFPTVGLSGEEIAPMERVSKPKSWLRQAQLPWGWATVE